MSAPPLKDGRAGERGASHLESLIELDPRELLLGDELVEQHLQAAALVQVELADKDRGRLRRPPPSHDGAMDRSLL
jgi:hypothetical protein